MRFRPLGGSGMVVSAVSMSLADSAARSRPSDWTSIIYTALENGINAFEVVGRHPAIAEGLGLALQSIERRLVFVSWRVGSALAPSGATIRDFSPDSMRNLTESAIARSGLGYLDAVVLDDPHSNELSPQALELLKAMREQGRTRMLGVAGEDDAIDAYISVGAFDLLCTPFSLISGWKERLRLKAAVERDMGVMGYNYFPDLFQKGSPMAKPQRATAEHPLVGMGTYAFLENTHNWKSEELCLAYALTEPCLASVQIVADRADRLESLAAITERDLPPGVGAQIEMARFSPQANADRARRA
jgi:aryl-alcohol dehydrogenase-like predicted oxidoreductase